MRGSRNGTNKLTLVFSDLQSELKWLILKAWISLLDFSKATGVWWVRYFHRRAPQDSFVASTNRMLARSKRCAAIGQQ